MSKNQGEKCYDCRACGEHIGRPRQPGENRHVGICKECSKNPANLSPAQRAHRARQAQQSELGPSYDCRVCGEHFGRLRLPGEIGYFAICAECSRDPANLTSAQREFREQQARENKKRRKLMGATYKIPAWGRQFIKPRRTKRTRGLYK